MSAMSSFHGFVREMDPASPAGDPLLATLAGAAIEGALLRLEQGRGWPMDRIDLGAATAPSSDERDIVRHLVRRLNRAQPAGTCRVVVHCGTLARLDRRSTAAIATLLAEAGAMAGVERPLARIGVEWLPHSAALPQAEVRLTEWPGAAPRRLALCCPLSGRIDWAA